MHKLPLWRVVELKNRKLVEFSILMEDVPGMLAKVSNVIAQEGINIIYGVHHESDEPNATWWCFFADFGDIDPDEVASKIAKVEGVKKIAFTPAAGKHLFFDTHHSSIEFFKERAVLFRANWLIGIFSEIYKRWGTGGRVFIYYLGFEGGKEAYEVWRKRLDLKGKDLIQVSLDLIQSLGWITGYSFSLDLENEMAIIKLEKNFECALSKNMEGSHFIRGVLAGFFTGMFGSECSVDERRCISKGDPYCEFLVRAIK
ncbi:MAG TPA: ACT domain-containing protein [Candidatus Korarchaeota archaeon]|nr:ACT domain-containing protein [Candidatus Korarchaeota archaeon]